jgi:hypothetical protein
MLKDLFVDHTTGKLSHSKLWSNIGLCIVCLGFSWYCYHLKADWDLFLIFGLLVTYPRQLKNFISLRFGQNINNAKNIDSEENK